MTLKADPIFIKLGGSLITDKTQPETPRPDVIVRLAHKVRQVRDARPGWPLLLSHGSGSFGHWLGERYGTRDGVQGHAAWVGYAHVAATAARLNRLVTDAFLNAGVPVLSTQPSASACCQDGILTHMDVNPIRRALDEGLVPLVYGDVALDAVRGGTIISTEEILAYLCGVLRPGRILLLGRTAGVYGPDGAVIPRITPQNVAALADNLGGARGMDVTGGMAGKVHQMLALVQRWPGLTVQILSGMEPGLLVQALLDPAFTAGTRITAAAR